MFLKHIDLTTALRPSYLPDEVLLFVQDNVGLYEGKFKLPKHQNGQVYLTSHRICYVDKEEPRSYSLALDLKDVDRYEYSAGFLRSSGKVTIIPKPPKRSSARNHSTSHSTSPYRNGSASSPKPEGSTGPPTSTSATWVCTICSFSNPVPSNFDPASANSHTPLPPCLACGIKPTLTHVLKASIANAKPHSTSSPAPPSNSALSPRTSSTSQINSSPELWSSPWNGTRDRSQGDTNPNVECPRCTFSNHPSLLSCEICGASLVCRTSDTSGPPEIPENTREDSPGPVIDSPGKTGSIDGHESVKISFRSGGEKIFYERLKGSMTQRKWLLHNAPPVPRSSRRADEAGGSGFLGESGPRRKTAGIAGLEQLGMNMRKDNELIIGSAFEDLEALMASAKDVVALAERLARQNSSGGEGMSVEENAVLAESAHQLGLVTTKDIVGGGSSQALYLSELARNLAEFLTDDSRGVLKKAGGIITLVDLWAMFNRARGGVELVSPMDFEKAARLWESLKLPVRLRTFRSGAMVVQGRDRTDEATVKALLTWLQDLHEFPPDKDVPWDWRTFGRGVTAQEAAERFGWSLGVAEEELLMAEERGAVCREEGLEGLKFWVNYIDMGDVKPPKTEQQQNEEQVIKALKAAGFI
ncbi:ESCRT-II complex subunit VPS36 [Geosmithia morbida]|uniref:Vacuolar protein-sorting-associated protein 36 n=1 Tax=Geosmithia morbida TaxID=1094350 RepID=A0A9P5D4V0_9HYPO|nr:ESCRT-II complex subunit VPS36 [Geosmithia morbida]KAF4126497.1 ESCRT-II complex subunit VPS36 [Geosmithia morbida]